jgi:inward rectifier potassium channel
MNRPMNQEPRTIDRPESANITIRAEPQDLGFGAIVGRANEKRLLNRDGSFNPRRRGLPFLQSLAAYHTLLTMSWPKFLGALVTSYFVVNAVFATIFVACGPGALAGPMPNGTTSAFARAFFFSVDTLATIGYGNVAPASLVAHIVVAFEALVGLLGLALWTGLLFARFSRPIAALIFSEHAIIAPYRDDTALMFRVVNGRSNQMVELEATVLFSRIVNGIRKYDGLVLERKGVVFFPLSWTIVHPINEKSPLWRLSREELEASDAEIMILITGTDETFSQSVHARSSYKPHEIRFGKRFASIYEPLENGIASINVRRLSELEEAG